MSEYKLTNYEKETIITYNEAEGAAECYTCSPVLMRKLDGLCAKSTEITVKKQDLHISQEVGAGQATSANFRSRESKAGRNRTVNTQNKFRTLKTHIAADKNTVSLKRACLDMVLIYPSGCMMCLPGSLSGLQT